MLKKDLKGFSSLIQNVPIIPKCRMLTLSIQSMSTELEISLFLECAAQQLKMSLVSRPDHCGKIFELQNSEPCLATQNEQA